jgi:wobble nucleotide-excising tRNase
LWRFEICRSLLSWVNEGSHTLPDDLYIEAPDCTKVKYLKVFQDIFNHTAINYQMSSLFYNLLDNFITFAKAIY